MNNKGGRKDKSVLSEFIGGMLRDEMTWSHPGGFSENGEIMIDEPEKPPDLFQSETGFLA